MIFKSSSIPKDGDRGLLYTREVPASHFHPVDVLCSYSLTVFVLADHQITRLGHGAPPSSPAIIAARPHCCRTKYGCDFWSAKGEWTWRNWCRVLFPSLRGPCSSASSKREGQHQHPTKTFTRSRDEVAGKVQHPVRIATCLRLSISIGFCTPPWVNHKSID